MQMINLFIYSLITLTNKLKLPNLKSPDSELIRESGTHEWKLNETETQCS